MVTSVEAERQRRADAHIERLSGAQLEVVEEDSTQAKPESIQDAREENEREGGVAQTLETGEDGMDVFTKERVYIEDELFKEGREKEESARRRRKETENLGLSEQEVWQLHEDETLAGAEIRGFAKEEGLIYRRWTPP